MIMIDLLNVVIAIIDLDKVPILEDYSRSVKALMKTTQLLTLYGGKAKLNPKRFGFIITIVGGGLLAIFIPSILIDYPLSRFTSWLHGSTVNVTKSR